MIPTRKCSFPGTTARDKRSFLQNKGSIRSSKATSNVVIQMAPSLGRRLHAYGVVIFTIGEQEFINLWPFADCGSCHLDKQANLER